MIIFFFSCMTKVEELMCISRSNKSRVFHYKRISIKINKHAKRKNTCTCNNCIFQNNVGYWIIGLYSLMRSAHINYISLSGWYLPIGN